MQEVPHPPTQTITTFLFFLFLIIVQSNDIESNPGPSYNSTKYMCGTCDNTVTWNKRGLCVKPVINGITSTAKIYIVTPMTN